MIAVPSFRRDFGYVSDGQFILPAKWQAAFNNISSIGQFFGGFLCSHVADVIGRKKSLALGIVICTGGIIGQVVTTSKGGFLGAKLVLGLGLGFYLTLGPLCCSEVSANAICGWNHTEQSTDYPGGSSWHFHSWFQPWNSHWTTYLQWRYQWIRWPHRSLGIQGPVRDPAFLRCFFGSRPDLCPRVTLVVGTAWTHGGCETLPAKAIWSKR